MEIDIPIMTDDEYNKLLEERKKVQLPKAYQYGYDGKLTVGHANLVYRGIPYYIGVLRYYNLSPTDMKINDIDMYAVVEHPDVSDDILEIANALEPYEEFLYYDTNHIEQRHYTLQQHIDCANSMAKKDIDWLLDEGIPEMEMRMREYRKTIEKLKACGGMKNDSVR